MCLYLDFDPKIEIAKTDITVWKVFKLSYFSGELESPFMGERWNKGETKKVRRFTGEGSLSSVGFRTNQKKLASCGKINEGLHSLATRHKAIEFRKRMWGGNTKVIRKCTIPKGTPFIRGADSEIVSLALTLNK